MFKETVPENLKFIFDSKAEQPTKAPLGATVAVLWQVILQLISLLKQVKEEVVELQGELRLHRAKRFGQSSEKQNKGSTGGDEIPPSEDEAEKDEGAEENGLGQEKVKETEKDEGVEENGSVEKEGRGGEDILQTRGGKKKRGAQKGHKGSGRKIPEQIEQTINVVELSEEEQSCIYCKSRYKKTGLTEDSYEVDIQITVKVVKHKRKRYERQCNCPGPRLITAPIPPKIIPKGKYTIGSWVKFLLDKYYGNVPLTRQIASLEFMGLPVCLGTLVGGFKHLHGYLEPLYEYFLSHLRLATRLHADETRWRVFAEVEGKKGHRWWLWVFLSDEVIGYILDPFRSTVAAQKALSTAISPADAEYLKQQAVAEGVAAPVIIWLDEKPYLLAPNLNTISADRYIIYQRLDDNIAVAFCWGHVRRDFSDFKKSFADQPQLVSWAETWIEAISQLYLLNSARLAVRSQPELFALAQTKLEQTLNSMQSKFDKFDGLTLKQQKILTSLKKHWDGLLLFVSNPDIPLDNNISERALRGPAGGRKTYYGHHAQWAGDLAAMLFTIIQTCLLNRINPYTFLIHYFEACARFNAVPSDIELFSPWLLNKGNHSELQLNPP